MSKTKNLTTPVELTMHEIGVLSSYYRHNGHRLDKYGLAIQEIQKLNTIKNREHKAERNERLKLKAGLLAYQDPEDSPDSPI